ncbi:4-hydroxy-tetrahydrodipicolinate synthase [Candidatus Vidania fulgoroideorum]
MKKIIVSIITPMKRNLKIDFRSIGRIVKKQLLLKNKNILINATTGESTSLSNKEKITVIRYISKKFGEKVKITAGSCYNSTRKSIKLIKKLNKEKIEYILQVTPYYYNTCERGIIKHFKAISKKSKIPILIYNVPKRTGIDLSSNCLRRLFNIRNIVGIKDSSSNKKKLIKKITICNEMKKLFLCGDDLQVFKLRNYKIDGVVSVLSSIFPKEIKKAITNITIGKVDFNFLKLVRRLSKYRNPLLIKWLLKELNMTKEVFRLPLVALKNSEKKDIKNYIEKYDKKFFKRIKKEE